MLTQRHGILEDMSDQIAGQMMLGVGRHLRIIPPPRSTVPPPYAITSLVGYFSRCTATFAAGPEAQGTMTALEAGKGEENTLPECEFENEGFVFHDWQNVTGGHYASGDTYLLDSSTTFEATWVPASVTASFDGGGAEDGSTDAISCARNKDIELPICGFKRKFHRFLHWELNGSIYKPGDKRRMDEDVMFTVVWELYPSKCLTVTCEFKTRSGDNDFIVVLNVRNDCTQTLNVAAEFDLFDSEKTRIGLATTGDTSPWSARACVGRTTTLRSTMWTPASWKRHGCRHPPRC